MINYPIKKDNKYVKKSTSSANRGMDLEELINMANDYYKNKNIAYVNKRPTNIKVIKTDGAYGIKEAVFLAASNLDYVGVYKGKYIDFDAKETANKKGFPLENISKHQIDSLNFIIQNGGYGFIVLYLSSFNEVYLLDGNFVIEKYNAKGSYIPYEQIKENGILIKETYLIPLDYITAFNKMYLEDK